MFMVNRNHFVKDLPKKTWTGGRTQDHSGSAALNSWRPPPIDVPSVVSPSPKFLWPISTVCLTAFLFRFRPQTITITLRKKVYKIWEYGFSLFPNSEDADRSMSISRNVACVYVPACACLVCLSVSQSVCLYDSLFSMLSACVVLYVLLVIDQIYMTMLLYLWERLSRCLQIPTPRSKNRMVVSGFCDVQKE